MIDLHVHSTFSDGSLTPEQIVEEARRAGLTAVALTDHDCTAGLERFQTACGSAGINAVPGVEISAEIGRGTLHMLGYWIDAQNRNLAVNLERIRDGRRIRNGRIAERLRSLGMDITMDEVRSYAGEDVVGRPHFAMALLKHGYVSSKQEAFSRYLAKGKPAYVDRFRLSPEDSIGLILDAGGVPVLAHPFTLELDARSLADYVAGLKKAGLCGIEAYYSEHSAEQRKQYLRMARQLDLAVSGGSDFHGEMNPAVKLGVGFGSLEVPDELIEGLLRFRDRKAV